MEIKEASVLFLEQGEWAKTTKNAYTYTIGKFIEYLQCNGIDNTEHISIPDCTEYIKSINGARATKEFKRFVVLTLVCPPRNKLRTTNRLRCFRLI